MIYLLTGDNTFELERRLKEIVDNSATQAERFDGSELSLEQLPDLFMGATLFATQRMIILRNVSGNKTVWSLLPEWLERLDGSTEVVLIETHPDKRTKTYKWLEKNTTVTEGRELQPHEAVKWVGELAEKYKMKLPREMAQFLVDYVGVDQWRLSSELEKLQLSGRPIDRKLIQELVEPTPQATSFELLDAVFTRRSSDIERLLSTVARSEDPYQFFGLLSSQIYALALVRSASGKSPDDIARASGVHPFVLRKVGPLASKLTSGEVKTIIERLAMLDKNMKLRPVEPWLQIKAFLLGLSSN